MGQYHYIANYDKKQYLYPHKFNDGLKLMEFGVSAQGTMTALAILLAASCQGGARGGGDIHPWTGGPGYEGREAPVTPERGEWLMQNVVGSWAGDRIAIIGDYAEDTDANGLVGREGSPFNEDTGWTDVSDLAREAILMDYYVWSDWKEEGRLKNVA